MTASYGVIVFPGTWSDTDWRDAIEGVLGAQAEYVFHKETDVSRFDCLVVPGGFSYGDYLRPGAIARFSPVMRALTDFAAAGGPVIGSCNGFQVLCESGLLPGALMRNASLEFRCQPQHLLVERVAAPFTSLMREGDVLAIPVSHGDGNYYADADTLACMEANGQIAFRYCDETGAVTPDANPNGSLDNIPGVTNQAGNTLGHTPAPPAANPNGALDTVAAVTNEAGNVLGLMPHPERVVEEALGGTDGLRILRSIDEALHERTRSVSA